MITSGNLATSCFASHLNKVSLKPAAAYGSLSLSKPNQGVFYSNPVATTEEAWAIAKQMALKPTTMGGRDIYIVPRQNSGYSGGCGVQLGNLDYVTIITESNTNRIVTAFSSGATPPLPKNYQSLLGK